MGVVIGKGCAAGSFHASVSLSENVGSNYLIFHHPISPNWLQCDFLNHQDKGAMNVSVSGGPAERASSMFFSYNRCNSG